MRVSGSHCVSQYEIGSSCQLGMRCGNEKPLIFNTHSIGKVKKYATQKHCLGRGIVLSLLDKSANWRFDFKVSIDTLISELFREWCCGSSEI